MVCINVHPFLAAQALNHTCREMVQCFLSLFLVFRSQLPGTSRVKTPSRYHSLWSANRNETMVSTGNLPNALVVMLQKTHWKEEHKVACIRKKATNP
jgi:hypothetical protein